MITRKNDAFLYRFDECNKDWEQYFLLISDVHFDSLKCDRRLLKSHLDEALEVNARILIFGDWFDCMGGKYDPRTTKADIRPEYQTQTYFDDIVDDSARFLAPYSKNIDMISEGNHETSVKLRHEIDLLSELSKRGLCNYLSCYKGKYNGFIRFQFARNGGHRTSKIMYYTHGGGGGAPVTRGAIKSNRRQDAVIADFYVAGHIHTEFEMLRPQQTINEQCNLVYKKTHHYQLGTYKNDFMDGGWADHKEHAPASLGGRWLKFYGSSLNLKFRSYLTNS